jgi:hypothetical protein
LKDAGSSCSCRHRPPILDRRHHHPAPSTPWHRHAEPPRGRLSLAGHRGSPPGRCRRLPTVLPPHAPPPPLKRRRERERNRAGSPTCAALGASAALPRADSRPCSRRPAPPPLEPHSRPSRTSQPASEPSRCHEVELRNLCSLLLVQKVLYSNHNSTITLTLNLFESCSTLRFFLWDASISKHRIWHNVQNLFKLYHNHHVWYMTSWQISWFFRLNLHFLEFKTNLATTSRSCLSNKTCKIFFDLRSDLKID